MTSIDWPHEAIEQLEWHWQHHLRPRFDGLTDDEYLWEPVPGCWSFRRRGEARTPTWGGAGDVVAEFQWPEPTPTPVTTIAWRIGHMAIGCFGERASNHFGDGSVTYAATVFSLHAAEGLALLDHHHDAWLAGIRSLGAEGMARPCGPAEGPFAEYPMGALVLHITREVIHHGAEVALLRDLYAHRTS
jgi:hypothetical protein